MGCVESWAGGEIPPCPHCPAQSWTHLADDERRPPRTHLTGAAPGRTICFIDTQKTIRNSTMGMSSFIQEAGEKLFPIGKEQAAAPGASTPSTEQIAALGQTAGQAIAAYFNSMGLKVETLDAGFNPASATVTAAGIAPDQATREEEVLCCGNIDQVGGMMAVVTLEPESQRHTVSERYNLSKIDQIFYGTPRKYPEIFETNKPVLSQPVHIDPAQMLRITAA